MSRVDVVIPCYNYARFLSQCVASVLVQDGVDIRALIIDDCSTDKTEQVGRSLAQQDERISFRRHSENLGHITTYNEGLLEWCSAEYSLLLSADDALAPGALARATELMDRHRNVGMTYGMAAIITDNTAPAASANVVSDAVSDGYDILSGPQFLQFCCARGDNPVPTPTSVVRTELQHRLGGYRLSLPHTGDMEMWMRFAAHASVGVIRAVQAYYRRHDENMSLQYYSQSLRDHREVFEACEAVLTRWCAQFSESRLWRESMHRRLGERALQLANSALDSGDTDGYHACLQFVEKVCPSLRRSRMWWHLRAKRFLGQPLWQGSRAVLAPLRSSRKKRSGPPHTRWDRQGNLIGRWPD